MKIGLVIPKASGYSETFFYNKINGLQSGSNEVVLFVNTYISSTCYHNIKVKVAPKFGGSVATKIVSAIKTALRSLANFKVSYRLYKLNKADGIDLKQNIKNVIINSHNLNESLDWLHFGFGTMALNKENVAKAIGAKMAVSFRGFDIAIYPIKNPGCYNRLWDHVDKIHVISDDIAKLVHMNGFKNHAPIVKITPAIDVSHFTNNSKPSIIHEKIHFVTIARLHWKKGLVYTLEALSILKQAGYFFSYSIIGDGEAYENLKFSVHQLDLTNEVVFLGRIPHNEVKGILTSGNIYLQYSVQEGFCNAVLEAQAMGLVCVVSDAEGLSENVLDGITGYVVPKRQPKLLASKLKEIIEMDQSRLDIISQQAQKRVKEIFNLEKQRSAFNSFYYHNGK